MKEKIKQGLHIKQSLVLSQKVLLPCIKIINYRYQREILLFLQINEFFFVVKVLKIIKKYKFKPQ